MRVLTNELFPLSLFASVGIVFVVDRLVRRRRGEWWDYDYEDEA